MSRRRTTWLIVLLIGVLSVLDHAGVFGYRGNDRLRYHGKTATVVSALSGDSYELDIPDGGSDTTRVRLWGVQCPDGGADAEKSGIAGGEDESDADREEGRALRTALEYARSEVVGRRYRIALEPNLSSRDGAGRLRVYLYEEEAGDLLNQALIAGGLARIEPDVEHIFLQEFVSAEKQARREGAGRWADDWSDDKRPVPGESAGG